MKSFKRIITALAVSAALSACSQPTSSGAGTDSSNQSSIDSAIAWTKKIMHGWTAKANVTVPAEGIIQDALSSPPILSSPIQGDRTRIYAVFSGKGKDFKKAMLEFVPGIDGNDFEFLNLAPVAAVLTPYRGWQIEVIGGFGEPEASPKQQKLYMGFQEAAVEYTNALFTEIATRLNNDVGVAEDPEAAKKEVQRIYKSIPKATLKKMWAEAVDHADHRAGRTVDLSGTKGVDWSADSSTYSGNDDGLTWKKNGIVWFGQGNLSGKQFSFGLESSVSKTSDKSSGDSESVNGGTGEKSSTSAQPK